METPEARTPEHRTVSRVMAILEAIITSGSRGLRLTDISDEVNAPKSSIHGLVRGLVTTGHLREQQGRYFQGPGLSFLTSDRMRVPPHFHRALEQLSGEWNESAILASLVGEYTVNIDAVEAREVIRASPQLHQRRALWPLSSGKVFLAFMEPSRRDNYLRRKHPNPTEREAIVKELALVRKERVAFNREESVAGLFGVSGRILMAGSVNMTIGLAGPASRMKPLETELKNAVLKAAESLSEFPADVEVGFLGSK